MQNALWPIIIRHVCVLMVILAILSLVVSNVRISDDFYVNTVRIIINFYLQLIASLITNATMQQLVTMGNALILAS